MHKSVYLSKGVCLHALLYVHAFQCVHIFMVVCVCAIRFGVMHVCIHISTVHCECVCTSECKSTLCTQVCASVSVITSSVYILYCAYECLCVGVRKGSCI